MNYAQKKIYPLPEIAHIYMQMANWLQPVTGGINNWDLVDVSSEHIIGPYLEKYLSHKERVDFIEKCITHENLWINRIIILASFHQIKQGNSRLTLYLAPRFLGHPHDLIHKAVGWMLREVGKRCSMDDLR